MLWITTLIACTALWPIYQSSALLILIAVALPLGTIIAILGARYKWPTSIVALAIVITFFGIGVQVAVPSQTQFGVLPTIAGLLDLLASVALGWKQLLTITLPVDDYEALLVPALVLVLLSTVVGLTTALRAKHRELAVLAPLTLFVIATAFGAGYPSRPLDAPIALMVASLLWLVWFRWYRRREAIRLLSSQSADAAGAPNARDTGTSGVRTGLGAALILVVASTAAIGALSLVPPTADRTVLRTNIEQAFDPQDYVSPLVAFRRYLQPALADTALFSVSGLEGDGRIRIATLDTYDGIVFSVGSDAISSESGSFTRVPFRFDQSDVGGTGSTISIEVTGYDDVWIPTVGLFEEITFSGDNATALRNGFYYNNTSATAASLAGIRSGDSFELTAVLPAQPATSDLAALDPGAATVPEARGVPAELTAKLDEYVDGVEGAGPRLVAMLAGLANEGYISHGIGAEEPASRSGHGADRIAELLTAPRMIGDGEQYAVTAALMARVLGFPSRVVFGFAPTAEVVSGSDVAAWIEINTKQFGWVAIDPTPLLREIPEEVPEDETVVARPPTVVPPPVVESETLDRQTTPESEQELPPDLNPVVQVLLVIVRILGIVAVVAGIVLAPFILIIAAKVRRRRLRRSAPSAIEQISGGWHEFHDAVIDHGLTPARAATRSEVAAIVGSTQSHVLAAIADRAVFSPSEPQPVEAEHVWRAIEELRLDLDEGLTRWQRLKAKVSLRSLGGYSVKELFKR